MEQKIDGLEIFNENILILSRIEDGFLQDPTQITVIFASIYGEIKALEKEFWPQFKALLQDYMELHVLSFQDPSNIDYYASYKKVFLRACKSLLLQKKSMDFLKRKFKKKEQTEDYSELVYLYTTLCLIMLSKESWRTFLKEYYLSLNAFLKGYTYTSDKELKDPTDYDSMIKECLLQLKKV